LTTGGLLLATVKTQNVVLGPILALTVLAMRPRRLALLSAAALLVVPLAYASSQPSGLRQVNLYNAVFYTLLPHGDDPARDLRALGIDPALANWSGSSAFEDKRRLQEPSFAAFAREGGQSKLIRFYVDHPGRSADLIARGTRKAAQIRPDSLGNRARLQGHRPREVVCEQCIYSAPSQLLQPLAPVLLPALYIGALVLGLWPHRKQEGSRSPRWTLIFLGVGGSSQFAAAVLGEGDYELAKHLYLFNVMTALLVVFGVLAMLERQADRLGTGPRDPAPIQPSQL
jgi:hypothetical protein